MVKGMRVLFRSLRFKLSRYGFIILWASLVIVYFAWLYLPEFIPTLEYLEEWGMSSSSFGIFGGSMATLSGTLVGILLAAMFIITQYAASSISSYKEGISKESEWLRQCLKNNKFPDLGISEDLEKVRSICIDVILEFSHEETNFDDIHNAVDNTLQSLHNLIEQNETNLTKLEQQIEQIETTKDSVNKKYLRNLEKEVNKFKETANILDELLPHIAAIFNYLPRFHASFLLIDAVSLIRKLTATFGLILITTLIFLVSSALQFTGKEFLSDSLRLNIAVALLLMFIPSIILMFNIMASNWRLINILIRGTVED